MKKIVVLGGSYLQSDFIETAVKSSNEVYVLDRDKKCYASNLKDCTFVEIDISDFGKVEGFFQKVEGDIIVSPVTEVGNRIAAVVAERNGLLYNSPGTVEATSNKWVMRKKLIGAGLKQPKFGQFKSTEHTRKKFTFPLIIKPPVSSASRGVSYLKTESGLEDCLAEALKYCQNKNEILLEEYISGHQYSIETISSYGKHFIVGITREYMSPLPDMIERTDVISPEFYLALSDRFNTYVDKLLNALGVSTGPCHIEVKLHGDDIFLIELASRSGLLRDRLIKAANGADYNQLILKAYSGYKINDEHLKIPENYSLLGIMMNSNDLLTYHRAINDGFVATEYFNGNKPVNEPKRLTDAFGYYILSGGRVVLDYKLN